MARAPARDWDGRSDAICAYAAPSARFNTAFLDVGVAGDMGGPWSLPRIVGAAKARELYFMPDKFDAAGGVAYRSRLAGFSR